MLYIFVLKNIKISKNNFCSSPRLQKNPHLKGLVKRLTIRTPKKPNSAIRHIIKVFLYKNFKIALVRIPGIGYLPNRYNRVLIRGGRANDLPGVRYTAIRGVFDFIALYSKKKKKIFLRGT